MTTGCADTPPSATVPCFVNDVRSTMTATMMTIIIITTLMV